MTREKLEKEIAATAVDIDLLNHKIAEMVNFIQKRDRLRAKLADLTRQYLGESFRDKLEEDRRECIFSFVGKTKDLPEALASEIRKAIE